MAKAGASKLRKSTEGNASKRRKGNKSNMSRGSPKALIEIGGGNVLLSKLETKNTTGALSPRPETSYFPPFSQAPLRPPVVHT